MEKRSKPAHEMAEDMARTGKLYGKGKTYAEISSAIKGDEISNAIAQQRQSLQRAWKRGKIDLANADEVRAGISEYLAACETAQVVPTLLGLAASFGLSRARIYFYCKQYANSESAAAIEAFRTAAAAVMAQGSLTRTLDAATSIFLMKNSGQNLQDRHEIEVQAAATSSDPRVHDVYEPFLASRGIDYSEMSDAEKEEAYLVERYEKSGVWAAYANLDQ